MAESYGIMPYSEMSKLKSELNSLKKKDSEKTEQLLTSVTSLTKSMDSMLHLFKTAADEMKVDDHDDQAIASQLDPIMSKLSEIIEQNKVIAEGMVALSDLIKERIPQKQAAPAPQVTPAPSVPPMQAPPPMAPPGPPGGMPPIGPPMPDMPPEPQKKGIFK